MPEIEIYSSNLCPYCWQAKKILDRHGASYREHSVLLVLGFKPPTKNFKQMVQRSGGKRTVPQIFIDGKYYGDEDNLKADEAAGKLRHILTGKNEAP